jgi:hypothetical protein
MTLVNDLIDDLRQGEWGWGEMVRRESRRRKLGSNGCSR